jgi:acyl-CoA synthetase (AMP-forming)/AMP-acid ligase II
VRRHGWHHTGDIGYIDEDGYIYIVDRIRDMVVSGGFNIFPFEVEQVLMKHPAVQDCAVIGVPHEKWGEAVKAVVQLVPGREASEEELIAFAKEELGGMKAPKSVDFIDDLPRSAVGKVLKREIRKPYWEGRERAVG